MSRGIKLILVFLCSNPIFSAYFSRQWQDTLLLSFHNFLMLVFASMPAPRLADYWSSAVRIKKLKEENQVNIIKRRVNLNI